MTKLDVDPELRNLYPQRPTEVADATRRRLTELEGKENRARELRIRSIVEAVGLFVIVDVVLIGIGWKLILVDLAVGCGVGYAWGRWRTSPDLSALLGVAGYLATLFVFGIPVGMGLVYYLVAAGLVGVVSRYMGKQRMLTRQGV